ncbi:MAG: alpha/beta hydrolase [Blastocatellia bacterium]|nr:MAG: alpha/beta hydrolase [Blastocatellia bacterium]
MINEKVQSIHNLSNDRMDTGDLNFLKQVSARIAEKPFKAHPIFSGAHAQTLAAYAWPRAYRLFSQPKDEERLFEVEPGVKVLAHCRWQSQRPDHPTVVVWHGMEGSSKSVYMIAMADKAFRGGFNVVRVNYRNCGGTEHLTPTLYHGGMSSDLRSVLNELITLDQLKRIYLIGFSLGGNLVLKLLGEYAENVPAEVRAACVVSPSVNLRDSSDLIMAKRNWLYHKNFVRSMKARVRAKHKLFPDLYDLKRLEQIETIRDFDENFTSLSNGFQNADDYYSQSSSIRLVDKVRIPTMIIHSIDDPFIPFAPMREPVFVENPHLLVIATDRGGHVAFIAADANGDVDRFWAENRVVEFCEIAEELLP